LLQRSPRRDFTCSTWIERNGSNTCPNRIQFDGVRNDPGETLAAFSERLNGFIESNDVDRPVMDLRWNNGGNMGLVQPLLLSIISNKKVNQRGRLFVILGRRTFSAAQNTATYFER
jgi:hypothetical protein